MHVLEPEKWIDNYGDYLFSVALFKTNNRELSEDLLQDTFLSALNARTGFQGTASEKTWLTTILNNKIIDHYRKNGKQQTLNEYVNATEASFSEPYFDNAESTDGHYKKEAFSGTWLLADSVMNQKEFQTVLEHCMQKLPEKILQVFAFKYYSNESSAVICKSLQITQANYWVIIHRAKLLLKTCLEKNWF